MGSAWSNFSVNFQNKLNEKKISQSTLYLLPIKDELIRLGIRDIQKNMFYRELFDLFVKNNIVPIGLYRNNSNFFMEEINQSYVYMCPGKDDLVDTGKDKIYILANEQSPAISTRTTLMFKLSTRGSFNSLIKKLTSRFISSAIRADL